MAWQRDDSLTSPLTPRLASPFLPSPGFPAAPTTSTAPIPASSTTTSALSHPYPSHPAPFASYAYPTPTSASYSLSAGVAARLAQAQLSPSSSLVNANAGHTRYVRLRVVQQGVGFSEFLAAGEGGRVAVGGKDVLKIIKFTNRLPSTPLPSSPPSPPPVSSTATSASLLAPQPVQRSLSDRGHSRRGRSKMVGPGGSTAEEVMNVWTGSKLSLVHAVQDVAWGHQNYSEKLLTAHVQGDCILWDLQRTGSRVETFLHEHARGRGVVRVLFSPWNAQLVLSGSVDGTCKLWDLRKPMTSVSTFRCNAPVSAACFSTVQGSSDFVAGLGNGAIQRFDYRMGDKGMVDWVSSAHSGAVQDLKWRDPSLSVSSFSEDSGTWLASCGMDRLVKVWDMDYASLTPSLTGAPPGNSYGSFAASSAGGSAFSTVSSGTSGLSGSTGTLGSGSGSGSASAGSSAGVPYNKPKQVLRTTTYNNRVAWRPGTETELVVVPYSGGLGGAGGVGGPAAAAGEEEGDVGEGVPEEGRISVWDVRRNYVPKYVLDGGTGAPRDVLFFPQEPDTLIASYHNSYVVQHDMRHHTRPIEALGRSALSWDGSGRLAFAAEEREGGEVPFDEPPYDPLTRLRQPAGKEHSVRGPRYDPSNQVAAGVLLPVPGGQDAESFNRIGRGYVITGAEKHTLCATNARVAREAGNIQAAQAWQMLHSLLLPLPMPSRSPSPMGHSTPGQKSRKFSYSPLSGSSRRATSAGPPRPKPRRGPSGRQLGRTRGGRRSTVAGAAGGGDVEKLSAGGEGKHAGQQALEDSDSEGDAGDEGEMEVSDVPVSPVESKGSEEKHGHTRNQHSESSTSSGVGASMRSPLSRTPVTADSIGVGGSALRRLSEMREEDEEGDGDVEAASAVEGPTDGETGNENDPESSSSAAEGGLMLKRGKPASKGLTQQYGEFHSSHGTRRNSIDSENANGVFVKGHRKTASGGSGTTQVMGSGRPARAKKKISASPKPMETATTTNGKQLPGRSRREVIEAEQRIREKGWEVMRTVFEGMMLEGDVQTCAVMGIVVGDELVQDQMRVVRIVTAYLELLARAQLYTPAAEVRKFFRAPTLQEETNENTQFDSSCAKCKKSLRGEPLPRGVLGKPGNYAYCKNCNRTASRCAICHLPSKGLFFLCPTCGHGGHEECFREYYLSHPMDTLHIFLQTAQVLPPHTLRSNRQSLSLASDATTTEDDDRTGRTTNMKRLRRGPGRVHPVEAADDTDDEAQKARFWERKRRVAKKVLLGHPCVAGCGHVCWVSNDRIEPELK